MKRSAAAGTASSANVFETKLAGRPTPSSDKGAIISAAQLRCVSPLRLAVACMFMMSSLTSCRTVYV